MLDSEEGYNDLDYGINGNTKGVEEIEELARVGLYSATTDSVEGKETENGNVPTTTTTTTTK